MAGSGMVLRGAAVGHRLAWAAALLALVLLPGCVAIQSLDLMDKEGDFGDLQKQYTQAIRWGKFDKARQFIAADARDDFRAALPELEDVRITDYEVHENDFDVMKNVATVRVTYYGYSVRTLVERSVEETQEWTKDPVTGDWTVTPDLTLLRSGVAGTRP